MQAIEIIAVKDRFLGRAEPATAFINAPTDNLKQWCREHIARNPNSRRLVPLSSQVLRKSTSDKWALKNELKDVYYIRDFFNYTLPIRSDNFFYGREAIVSSLKDNIDKTQNSGIFGLRKTGKTTVLLRLQRLLRKSEERALIFIDCKKKWFKSGDCDSLCKHIVGEIDAQFGRNYTKKIEAGGDAGRTLEEAVKSIPRGKAVCIVFDEIEYISPISPDNGQWKKEFIDFFQILWAIQTETEKLCFLLCGVNPSVCERDRFESHSDPSKTIQNPVFGIVKTSYLQGFDFRTLRSMVIYFGDMMGMRFSEDAIQYLFERYGGHPLLCRLACSYHHEALLQAKINRPIPIDRSLLLSSEDEREDTLANYCEHILSEMREFYGNEFDLIEAMCLDDSPTVYSLSRDAQAMSHLESYGLIKTSEDGKLKVSIPVVARYLRRERQRNSTTGHWRKVIKADHRPSWLESRKYQVTADLQLLNEALEENGEVNLYKGEAPKGLQNFLNSPVVTDQNTCEVFISSCFRTFVEPIVKHQQISGDKKLSAFEGSHAELNAALERMRRYRHMFQHSNLDASMKEALRLQMELDFGGEDPARIDDGWFMIQQLTLDNFDISIQQEIAKT